MKQKVFKLLALGLYFSMAVPILVYAEPDPGQIKDEDFTISMYDFDTPEEMTFPESAEHEDTYHIIGNAADGFESTERRTFPDYFPDPNFARGVAIKLNKEITDFVTEEELSEITSLSLSHYNITTIQGDDFLTNLTGLDLSNNQISEIPDSIGQLSNLMFLSLGNNTISEISDCFGKLSNLETLNLDNNNIDTFPDSICQLSELKVLSMANNNIDAIPDSIGQLSNLIILYLSHNSIATIPDSIGQLSNLLTLNLDYNQIATIPDSIKRLYNLESLSLVNNEIISEIPSVLFFRDDLSVRVNSQKGSLSPLHFTDLSEISYKNLLSPLILQAKDNNRGVLGGTWNITNPDGSTASIAGGHGSEINSSLFEMSGKYLVTFIWTANAPYSTLSALNFTSEIEIEVERSFEAVHQVTLTTRYRDNALPENTASYQVEHNAPFLGSFEVLEGYELNNSTIRSLPVFDIDMDDKTVGLSTVDRDYTIVLEFYKAGYKVNLETSYLDGYLPDVNQTTWIRPQTGYIQIYEIAEGYQVVNLDQLPADVIVDENTHTVTIKSVKQDYDILLELERKQYDITVRVIYEDGLRDDQISTYVIPHDDKFETIFDIEQGYSIQKINFNAAGVSVNRAQQEINIDRVTSPVEIIIVVR